MSAAYIHPPRTMMEVFKSLPEGTLVQLIENNLVMSPAPLDRHQRMVLEIASDLHMFVKKSKAGTVRTAPYDVYLDPENVYQPDICFISNARLDFIKADGLHGAPDLVIEILSPGTARYDLYDKKAVYERCGVTELWFVDPADNAVTGYEIIDKKYVLFFKDKGRLVSKLLAFEIIF